MPPASIPLPRIADYELLRLIGRGSYGDVWLARGVTGVFRAVKIVWRDRFGEARPYEREFEGITRFTAISLREPSQLALLHVGRDEGAGFFYYVMELADDLRRGRDLTADDYVPFTLKELHRSRGHLPAAETTALGVALARALASLHASGLVHRDIKPSNIVFVGGVPKLADLGLVATAREGATFVGTEGYVPSEGPGAPPADVYSLGKVLYELVTGLDRQEFPQLPADFRTRPDRAEFLELNEIILRACDAQPRARHPDAAALLDELMLLQAGKSVRRLRHAERRTARALRAAGFLAAIALVAGVGAAIERRRANEELARREHAEAERDTLARRAVYKANLTQAQRALESGAYGRARQFLRAALPTPGVPDLRGFEWQVLAQDAQGDDATVLRADGPPGDRVRFSSAAALVAAHTTNEAVTLWDAGTRRELRQIEHVYRLADFSPDGQWIYGTIVQNQLERLHRWRTADGQLDAQASFGASFAVGALADARWLVFNSRGVGQTHFLRSVDFDTGKEIWRREVPFTGATEAGDFANGAVAPDGESCTLVLVHGRTNQARWRTLVLSLPELAVIFQEAPTTHHPLVAYGRSRQELFRAWTEPGASTSELELLSLPAGTPRWHTRVPSADLTALAYDQARLLAVSSGDGSITLCDASTGAITGSRHGHESSVQDIFLPPDDAQLLSTGNGGDVRLWPHQSTGKPVRLAGFLASTGGGRALCLSPDGRYLAATDPDNRVRVLATENAVELAGAADGRKPIAFSTDGRSLWMIDAQGALEERSLEKPGTSLHRFTPPFPAFIATLSSDGHTLACADTRGALAFARTTEERAAAIDSGHGYPYWIALSAHGEFAATSGSDLSVRLWDISHGRVLATWKTPGQIANGIFSPDGRWLVLVGKSGALDVRDLREFPTRVHSTTLVTSSGILEGVAFHPSAPRLFVGGRDGVVHVFDTLRWEELAQLRTDPAGQKAGKISRLAMAADGSLLAGFMDSGVVRLWRESVPP